MTWLLTFPTTELIGWACVIGLLLFLLLLCLACAVDIEDATTDHEHRDRSKP